MSPPLTRDAAERAAPPGSPATTAPSTPRPARPPRDVHRARPPVAPSPSAAFGPERRRPPPPWPCADDHADFTSPRPAPDEPREAPWRTSFVAGDAGAAEETAGSAPCPPSAPSPSSCSIARAADAPALIRAYASATALATVDDVAACQVCARCGGDGEPPRVRARARARARRDLAQARPAALNATSCGLASCVRIARQRYGDSRATAGHPSTPPARASDAAAPPPCARAPSPSCRRACRRGSASPGRALTAVPPTAIEVRPRAARPGRPNDPALPRHARQQHRGALHRRGHLRRPRCQSPSRAERTLVVIPRRVGLAGAARKSARRPCSSAAPSRPSSPASTASAAARRRPPRGEHRRRDVTSSARPIGSRRDSRSTSARTTVSVTAAPLARRGAPPNPARVRVAAGLRRPRRAGRHPAAAAPAARARVGSARPAVMVLVDGPPPCSRARSTARLADRVSRARSVPFPRAVARRGGERPASTNSSADRVGDAARTWFEVPDTCRAFTTIRVSAHRRRALPGPAGQEAVRVVVSRVAPAWPPNGTGDARPSPSPTGSSAAHGASLAPVAGPEIDRLRATRSRCAATYRGRGTAEFAIAAERPSGRCARFRLDDVDARAGTATARVHRAFDGTGAFRARFLRRRGRGRAHRGAASPWAPPTPACTPSWCRGPPARTAALRPRRRGAGRDRGRVAAAVVDAAAAARAWSAGSPRLAAVRRRRGRDARATSATPTGPTPLRRDGAQARRRLRGRPPSASRCGGRAGSTGPGAHAPGGGLWRFPVPAGSTLTSDFARVHHGCMAGCASSRSRGACAARRRPRGGSVHGALRAAGLRRGRRGHVPLGRAVLLGPSRFAPGGRRRALGRQRGPRVIAAWPRGDRAPAVARGIAAPRRRVLRGRRGLYHPLPDDEEARRSPLRGRPLGHARHQQRPRPGAARQGST